jgi:hypothetical protein
VPIPDQTQFYSTTNRSELLTLVSGYRLHNGGIVRRVIRWHSLDAIHWRAPRLVRTARSRIPGSARIERRSDKTDDPSPFSGRRALGSLSTVSFPFTGGAVVWMP